MATNYQIIELSDEYVARLKNYYSPSSMVHAGVHWLCDKVQYHGIANAGIDCRGKIYKWSYDYIRAGVKLTNSGFKCERHAKEWMASRHECPSKPSRYKRKPREFVVW
jgi:hypothetical protein